MTDALAFASRAWRRPLTPGEKASLRAFYERPAPCIGLDHDGARAGARWRAS